MKKYLLSVIFVLAFTLSVFGQTTVAVVPFTGLTEKESSSVADAISTELDNLRYYKSASRSSAISAILKDRTAQRNGIMDTEALATLGKSAFAEFVISGHVITIGNSQMAFINIVDVENSIQVIGDYVAYVDIEALVAYMPKIVKILTDGLDTDYKKQPVVAVIPFDAENRDLESDRNILMPMFVAQIASSGKYGVVLKTAAVEKFMKEKKIQQKDFTDRAKAAQVGRAVGAEYVIFGSFTKMLSSNYMESYIVDVKKSSLLDSSEKRYKSLAEGLQLVSAISTGLTGVKSKNGHVATEVPAKPATTTPTPAPVARPTPTPAPVTKPAPAPTPAPVTKPTPTPAPVVVAPVVAAQKEDPNKLPDISLREALRKYEGKTGITQIADLLKSGVNTRYKNNHVSGNNAYVNQFTPLMIASIFGYTDLVIALIHENANLDAAVNETTSLMLAINNGHKEIFDILLSQGADFSINNCAALNYAIRKNNKYFVEQLLAAGIDVHRVKLGNRVSGSKVSALVDACGVTDIDIDILRMLINAGVSVNDVNSSSETPLVMIIKRSANTDALRKVKMQKMQLLVDAGTNVNLPDRNGETALMHAVGYTSTQYDLDLFNLLLNNNALVNAVNKSKATSLDILSKKSKGTIRDKMIEVLEASDGLYGYEL